MTSESWPSISSARHLTIEKYLCIIREDRTGYALRVLLSVTTLFLLTLDDPFQTVRWFLHLHGVSGYTMCLLLFSPVSSNSVSCVNSLSLSHTHTHTHTHTQHILVCNTCTGTCIMKTLYSYVHRMHAMCSLIICMHDSSSCMSDFHCAWCTTIIMCDWWSIEY